MRLTPFIVAAAVAAILIPTSSASAASPGWRQWAHKQEHRAALQRAKVCQLRTLLHHAAPRAIPHAPPKNASNHAWDVYGKRCHSLTQVWTKARLHDYRLILHPAGSGARRWWPLAQYVGWPKSEGKHFVHCVGAESGGDPTQISPTNDHGLMQINGCHAATFRKIVHLQFYPAVYNPAANLRYGLWLWRHEGWRPWTTMRGVT